MQGHCQCGAIRFEVSGPIQDVGNCHCSICRRLHGTPFSSFARVAKGDLKLLAGAERVKTYATSEPCERSFCGTCGSHFTFRFNGLPDAVWVSAGLLDDEAAARPSYHMFVGSKASWEEIADGLPQHAEYPPEPEG